MARPTINSLERTRYKRWWPSKAAPGREGARFETVAECRAEDALRARSTRRALRKHKRELNRKSARTLAERLDYEASERSRPHSTASAMWMRSKRDAIFSQAWRLVDRYDDPVTTATVIKRGWEFPPEKLPEVDVSKLLKGFLADLDRRGAGWADGWLIAFLHGEWATPTEVYRLHLHMIVAGEMIDVVDRLRKGRNYKHHPDDNVRFRVKIGREPLSNLPHPLAYCLKAYWPWKHVSFTKVGKRRNRKHKRIPEPYHTQVLLFLDKHDLSDLVVLKHVSVHQGRLKPAKRTRRGK